MEEEGRENGRKKRRRERSSSAAVVSNKADRGSDTSCVVANLACFPSTSFWRPSPALSFLFLSSLSFSLVP